MGINKNTFPADIDQKISALPDTLSMSHHDPFITSGPYCLTAISVPSCALSTGSAPPAQETYIRGDVGLTSRHAPGLG